MPWFDGAILSREWKEAVWDKFVTGAPRPRTLAELQYSGSARHRIMGFPRLYDSPEDAEIIDCGEKSVIPGLIDAHWRFTLVVVSQLPAKAQDVPLAFGTDILFDPAGTSSQGRQLAKFARFMSPLEALEKATGAAGQLLAMSGPRSASEACHIALRPVCCIV